MMPIFQATIQKNGIFLRRVNEVKLVKRIIFSVVAVLLFCTLAISSGCSPKDSHNMSQINSDDVLREILSSEEIKRYRDFINDIAFKSFFSSHPHYSDSPDEYAQLYTISLKGIPVLIDETSSFNSMEESLPRAQYGDYWQYGTITLLRCYKWHFKFSGDPLSKSENFYTLFTSAKTDCPQILSSSDSTEEQLKRLRYYGILAIPYIQDRINEGHTEYESFFIEIGLHLTADEFAQIVSVLPPSSTTHYDNIRNHPKAEDFDYKVWLSENEEDLDNLFKFLDAYCEEYERENLT